MERGRGFGGLGGGVINKQTQSFQNHKDKVSCCSITMTAIADEGNNKSDSHNDISQLFIADCSYD